MRSPARAARRLGVSAFASPRTRRLYPLGVGMSAAGALGELARRTRASPWRDNVAFYSELLRYTPLAGSEQEVAQQAVAEFFRCAEVYWRPWQMRQGQFAGLEHYQAAVAQGRGVVGVYPHFGNPYQQFPIMPQHGFDVWAIVAPHHYMDLGNGYFARFARQGRAYLDMLGEGRTIVRSGPDVPTREGAFAISVRHLQRGSTVTLAFDSEGSLATPFMGRQLRLASGPAKLACATDALLVPYLNRVDGSTSYVRFAPALDPRDHSGPEALQAALAAVMEAWAYERPWSVWPLESQPGGPPLINGPALTETAEDAPAPARSGA